MLDLQVFQIAVAEQNSLSRKMQHPKNKHLMDKIAVIFSLHELFHCWEILWQSAALFSLPLDHIIFMLILSS